MTNYGFIIDNRKCIGCHACTVACKSEHDVPVGVNRTWVKYIEKGTFPQTTRLFSVMRCNHCDNAPCVEICPVTALYRRADGIVDFDNRRCIGCRACMQACPYDALYIDPETHTAAKCNYCAHRVDRGLEPACVNVCPTHAIISGDLDDPNSEISQLKNRQQVTTRKQEKGTLPALYYIDGDTASLVPGQTESTGEGMWSQQSRGVGHYAKFLQQRLDEQHAAADAAAGSRPMSSSATAIPDVAASDRANGGAAGVRLIETLEKFLALGNNQSGVLDPQHGANSQAAGRRVAQEVSRRVYDAPRKGTLWGWQVPAYMWTKAISAGAVIVPLLVAMAGWAAPAMAIQVAGVLLGLTFLALTGGLLAGDLDQPKRFVYVLLRPQWRSWLVRGAYIISAYAAVLVLWLLSAWSSGGNPSTWLGVVAIGLAAATAMYTSFLFAQAKARDFWQSPLLGLHMLVHAVLAGSAVFLIQTVFSRDPHWHSCVMQIAMVAVLAKLLCDGLELTTTHATSDAAQTAREIMRGRYRWWYWLGVVVIGCLLPLVMLISSSWLFAPAGILILIGIYIAEYIWVTAPQDLPLA